MIDDKLLVITGDLLKPKFYYDTSIETFDDEAIKWITSVLKILEIESKLIWNPNNSIDFDTWVSCENTPEILESYLNLYPTLLQSAGCVVGWELPTGLRFALQAQDILWVSLTRYLWSPRSDILSVESSDPSLLKAIHQPLTRSQPTWTFDRNIRPSSLLIVEPPAAHYSRIQNGKVYSLNDYTSEISELLSHPGEIYVFPHIAVLDLVSPTLQQFGIRSLEGFHSISSVYFSSERITTIASLDASVEHVAKALHKPFHCWNKYHTPSALLSYRSLKSRSFWEEILNRRKI